MSCFLFLGFTSIGAQDVPSRPLSIPVFQPMAFNPAYVGSKDFSNISLTSKISRFPNQQIMSFHRRLTASDGAYSNWGIGAYAFHERFDYSWNSGLAISGAYHIPIDEERLHSLAFGASLKGIALVPREDQNIFSDTASAEFSPNVDIGAYYYGPRGFGGVSLTTLVPGEEPDSSLAYAYVGREYHLWGGYKFILSRQHGIVLEPSLLLSVNDQNITEAHKHLAPYLKLYLQNFYIGSYLRDLDIFALFFQYQFPRFYTGLFLEFPRVGTLNNDNIIFELSLGLNLGKEGSSFMQYRHW